ncbi:hypothetical protein L198_06402 [Cryptococcus wingfieldii CBS 7118]|uniref:Uncharacterized protein n=1 Tax=Cryptococcus wingfieldii CBS 7118 TaxID=1295528 RepID=A0A1E3IM81_9TREE|nr:hypothetical protein L198_06402 [Cryptococcus wingfieldii CBS 7118]ODN89709.1 hypothetical protein L198_06402 [Cryptococcus wingfieldii CBS 7118]
MEVEKRKKKRIEMGAGLYREGGSPAGVEHGTHLLATGRGSGGKDAKDTNDEKGKKSRQGKKIDMEKRRSLVDEPKGDVREAMVPQEMTPPTRTALQAIH